MKCTNCGKEIANDSVFCEFCGTKVQKQQSPAKKGNAALWVTLGIIGGLIIAGIIVAIVMSVASSNYSDYKYSDYSKNNSINEEIPISNTLNGHEWVDLGLPSGTKWATCNVGASVPGEYGDYFAWGETTPKSYYGWDNYKYCNGDPYKLTKYCFDAYFGNNGFIDNLTTLERTDYATTANWGNGWRMPTKAELEELIGRCSWTWTNYGGSNGYRVTGPNGNTIFLPAAGYSYNGSLRYDGINGCYWSNLLCSDYTYFAWHLWFSSGDYITDDDFYRSCGFTVRAVCQP